MLLNLAIAAAIVVVGYVAGSWLASVSRMQLTRTGMDPEIRRLVSNSIQPLTVTAAVIAALPWVGVEPTSLVAVLGAATLAIGMALKSSLSNVASGAILLTLRPYREGDTIEVAGRQGNLEALHLYATVIRTPDGTIITLPNDLVMRAPIVNLTRNGRRRADVVWTIGPDGSGIATALAELQVTLQGNSRVLSDPAPTVQVTGQVAGGIQITGRAWVETPDLGAAKAEILTSGLEALAAAKVPLATHPGL